ncbi:hypothetical protein Trydic_g19091 [Trypoxylus dichotomus]
MTMAISWLDRKIFEGNALPVEKQNNSKSASMKLTSGLSEVTIWSIVKKMESAGTVDSPPKTTAANGWVTRQSLYAPVLKVLKPLLLPNLLLVPRYSDEVWRRPYLKHLAGGSPMD